MAVENIAVEYRRLDVLVPYARNSREHTDDQVAAVAGSIREFGFVNPVLVDESGGVVAGHCRVMAARKLGMESVPCVVLEGLTEAQRRAYVIADNRLAERASWDFDMLQAEFEALEDAGFDLDLTGFEPGDREGLDGLELEGGTDPVDGQDEVPDVEDEAVSRPGDVWIIGGHRIMCGDSTDPGAVAQLCGQEAADVMHADPPYGMGKESDGVANDNLRREKLDAFQTAWWRAFRPFLSHKASAYVWGNAPDLWRWWYSWLEQSELLTFENELVWDKGSAPGMKSESMTQYVTASERCLFFKLGQQVFANVNSEDFPDAWVDLLDYLAGEARAAGLTSARCKEVTGTAMFAHWFTRSQFTLPGRQHYEALQSAFPGHFVRPWAELNKEWEAVKGAGHDLKRRRHEACRSFFDNAHESMRDTWQFDRVTGEERHGHATPKPVDMLRRVMRTSAPEAGLVVEPFLGSGSTVVAAHAEGRRCYAMELSPQYVDLSVRRLQEFTGLKAKREADGAMFDGC